MFFDQKRVDEFVENYGAISVSVSYSVSDLKA